MSYSDEKLNRIFHRSGGKCHLCNKRIAWKNYGVCGLRGAWEVDHSRARASGGTDHGNNLYAACISCNRSKQHGSTRTVRRVNGLSRAPLSTVERSRRRQENAVAGGAAGFLIGSVFGLPGMIAGPLIGAALGADADDGD
jgi:hypothetical protein